MLTIAFPAPTDAAAREIDHAPAFGVTSEVGPIELWHLESIVTGHDFEVVSTRPRGSKPVAMHDGGVSYVLALNDELVDGLVEISDLGLPRLAAQWQSTDELIGWDLDDVLGVLRELRALAREVQSRDISAYLWCAA